MGENFFIGLHVAPHIQFASDVNCMYAQVRIFFLAFKQRRNASICIEIETIFEG